jgi:hypothetical protein
VTGIYVLLLLVDLLPKAFLAKLGILGMPGFWFGGPWLAGPVLDAIDWKEIQSAYIFTLAVTWVPFALLGTAIRMIEAGVFRGRHA